MTTIRIPPDHKPIVEHARAHGWELTRTRGGHLRLRSPHGATVLFGCSPSDHRAVRNLRADLRRNGLVTP